ncbi:flagellar M-ring protein FliF [bacterium]|nr:flagellar M-ring protein FliF [bacterium]
MAVICFLISLALAGFYWSKPEMKAVASGLNEEQASQVVHKLEELKVQYQLGENGAILVPSSELKRLRLELASSGLPENSEMGFSLFDRVNLQMSEFTEKVTYLRAIQGELSETIRVIPGVVKVRVHLNLPEDSLLVQEQSHPTASVLLQLKPGARLSRTQCRGILRLVACSVEGMKTENVSLTDTSGTLLFSGEEDLLQNPDHQEELLSRSLQRGAQTVLDNVVGLGRGVVSVRVELQKDVRQVERTIIEPDKEGKGFEKSRKLTSEEYQGTMKVGASNTTVGNATTAGNVVQVEAPGSQRPSYKQTLQQVEFEYSKRVESVQDTPNRIRRITASVVVDGAVKLDAASQDSLKKAVGLAIGIDPSRGDECTVQVLMFSREQEAKEARAEAESQQKKGAPFPVLWTVVGLVATLGGGLIVTLILRRRKAREAALDLTPEGAPGAALLGSNVDIALPAEAESAPDPEQVRRELLERVRATALERPELVARVIHNWVNNERGKR